MRQGQTLSGIAHRYHMGVDAVARANHIRSTRPLRVGQVLVIPTGGATDGRRPGESEWGRPRRPGVVKMTRLGKKDRLEGRLVDAHGRARTSARRTLARLMRSDGGVIHLPNPKLLTVLTKLSDHFGGRRIVVVSGYRPPGGYTRETSRHTRGDAIDIRIDGVPITAIRDYCRSFPDLGCGYYPRSQFVHVDVRARSAYWVDWAGPGEAPQYERPAGATDGQQAALRSADGVGGAEPADTPAEALEAAPESDRASAEEEAGDAAP